MSLLFGKEKWSPIMVLLKSVWGTIQADRQGPRRLPLRRASQHRRIKRFDFHRFCCMLSPLHSSTVVIRQLILKPLLGGRRSKMVAMNSNRGCFLFMTVQSMPG